MPRNPFDQKPQPPAPEPENDWNGQSPTGDSWEPLPDTWGTPPEAPESPKPQAAKPARGSHIEAIPTATWEAEKRVDHRKREKPHKVPLLPEIRKRLLKHIQRLNVPEYELVRYLLEYGLDAVQSGELVFEAQLSRKGLTLYPDPEHRKTRRRDPGMITAVYRGIPDETWEQVKRLATGYPIWQVANKLLEHGLNEIEAGHLQPQPQPSGARTLFP